MSVTVPNPGAQWTDPSVAKAASILAFVQDPRTLFWVLLPTPDFGTSRGSLTVNTTFDVISAGIVAGAKRPTKLPNGFVVFY